MICITVDQMRAAMREDVQDWRAKSPAERAAIVAEWNTRSVEEYVDSLTDRTLDLLKKHGAKQTAE